MGGTGDNKRMKKMEMLFKRGLCYWMIPEQHTVDKHFPALEQLGNKRCALQRENKKQNGVQPPSLRVLVGVYLDPLEDLSCNFFLWFVCFIVC